MQTYVRYLNAEREEFRVETDGSDSVDILYPPSHPRQAASIPPTCVIDTDPTILIVTLGNFIRFLRQIDLNLQVGETWPMYKCSLDLEREVLPVGSKSIKSNSESAEHLIAAYTSLLRIQFVPDEDVGTWFGFTGSCSDCSVWNTWNNKRLSRLQCKRSLLFPQSRMETRLLDKEMFCLFQWFRTRMENTSSENTYV
ncbi:unnamed protein product [Mytilus edulis]|uniref:Uncharacterized protein n=1 Tax=Mytilus edulis TaxID=6550 RepID=A0A8S3SXW9_MYTED|nr:unnamed protein product [Mytilus edulis]